MVTSGQLRSEFALGIYRRVDVAPQSGLGQFGGTGDRREWSCPDDEHVDVAVDSKGTACRGPKHGCQSQLIGDGTQGIAQHVCHAYGLRQETSQIGEHRALLVRLKVHLAAVDAPGNHASLLQQGQFALDPAQRGSSFAGELAKVERFVRMTEQPPKNPTTCLAEQDGSDVAITGRHGRVCTHIDYKCIQCEYARQQPRSRTAQPPSLLTIRLTG